MTGPAPAPPPPQWPEHLQPGKVVSVAPGVGRLIAPNPSFMTGPGTNTYLIGAGDVAVVDPGPDDDAHLAAILEATGGRVGSILVTHTHIDHSPLAARLKVATGAQVVGFGPPPPELPGSKGAKLDAHDTGFVADRRMTDGDRLSVAGVAIDAVYTPGHASNHLCFELAGTGLMFSGDHVMSGSTVVIAPPDGDMGDYFESLEKVRSRAPTRIAPGHGDMIDDASAVLDEYLRHRRARESQVVDALSKAPAGGLTPEQLVEVIYTDVPPFLHPIAKYSVWAHLLKLRAEGRASSAESDDPDAPWR